MVGMNFDKEMQKHLRPMGELRQLTVRSWPDISSPANIPPSARSTGWLGDMGEEPYLNFGREKMLIRIREYGGHALHA